MFIANFDALLLIQTCTHRSLFYPACVHACPSLYTLAFSVDRLLLMMCLIQSVRAEGGMLLSSQRDDFGWASMKLARFKIKFTVRFF